MRGRLNSKVHGHRITFVPFSKSNLFRKILDKLVLTILEALIVAFISGKSGP